VSAIFYCGLYLRQKICDNTVCLNEINFGLYIDLFIVTRTVQHLIYMYIAARDDCNIPHTIIYKGINEGGRTYLP